MRSNEKTEYKRNELKDQSGVRSAQLTHSCRVTRTGSAQVERAHQECTERTPKLRRFAAKFFFSLNPYFPPKGNKKKNEIDK